MELIGKKVKVVCGYYEGLEGIIKGETVDNYLLVMPADFNGFWARPSEIVVIN